MYSWLITRTAAAEVRISTLAKRAKPSSLNMPLKAVRDPGALVPIQTASASISAPVVQTMAEASLSFPV